MKITIDNALEVAELLRAFGTGKKLEARIRGGRWWQEITPVQFQLIPDDVELRIKPEPVIRPMTRGEVLYMVTTTPGMVARYHDGMAFPVQHSFFEECELSDYEYAIIDKHGNPIDGWHKFETTEPMSDTDV